MPKDALTYQDAGVDIDAAQRALRAVSPEIQSTYTEGVVAGVGGFGGLFRGTFEGYDRPLLVSSIDGIGTKTKIAATHLRAIEQDAFHELPALVYTRGFVQELAKCLRLDPPQVARTYLKRMRESLASSGRSSA